MKIQWAAVVDSISRVRDEDMAELTYNTAEGTGSTYVRADLKLEKYIQLPYEVAPRSAFIVESISGIALILKNDVAKGVHIGQKFRILIDEEI